MTKQEKLEKLGVKFIPVSMIEFKVQFPNANYKIKYVENSSRKIQSISFDEENVNIDDMYIMDVGQKLKYVTKHLTKYKDTNTFIVMESEYNLSTIFLAPLICSNMPDISYIRSIDNRKHGYLLNVFVDCDFCKKKDDYSCFVLLKYSKSETFKTMESKLVSKSNFVKAIDFNSRYVLYEFSIEDKFKDDFIKMLNGDYSKISKIAKSRIKNFHKDSIDGSFSNGVINKDSSLRKQYEEDLGMNMDEYELCSKFGVSEILNKEDYECIE